MNEEPFVPIPLVMEAGRGMVARNLLDEMVDAETPELPRITSGMRTPPSQQINDPEHPASQAQTRQRGSMSSSSNDRDRSTARINPWGSAHAARARGRSAYDSFVPPSPARDPRQDPRLLRRGAHEAGEDEDADMPVRAVPATGGVITAANINPRSRVTSPTLESSVPANINPRSRAISPSVAPLGQNLDFIGGARSFTSAFHTADNERNVRMRAAVENAPPDVMARALERGLETTASRDKWRAGYETDLRDVTEIQKLIANAVLERVSDIPNTAKIYDWLEEMNDDKWQQLVRAELRGDVRVTGDCLDFIETLLKRLREMHTKIVDDMHTKASGTMSIEGMYDLLVITYNKFVERKRAMKVNSASSPVFYSSSKSCSFTVARF